jgi:hypothetical protein
MYVCIESLEKMKVIFGQALNAFHDQSSFEPSKFIQINVELTSLANVILVPYSFLTFPFDLLEVPHPVVRTHSHNHFMPRKPCSILLKSSFLSCCATKSFEKAPFRVRQLQQLRKPYEPVDFQPLQGSSLIGIRSLQSDRIGKP